MGGCHSDLNSKFTQSHCLPSTLGRLGDSQAYQSILANLSQRHSFLALCLKYSLVLLYNSLWSFTKSTIASSSEPVRYVLVLLRNCDELATSPPTVSVSVSLRSLLGLFSGCPSSWECDSSTLALASLCCYICASSLSHASLSSLLC